MSHAVSTSEVSWSAGQGCQLKTSIHLNLPYEKLSGYRVRILMKLIQFVFDESAHSRTNMHVNEKIWQINFGKEGFDGNPFRAFTIHADITVHICDTSLQKITELLTIFSCTFYYG